MRSVSQPDTTLIVLGDNYETALEIDYRLRCESSDPDFADVVQEANDLIKPLSKNQAKGLIARYVARKILSNKPTYCPEFVRRIADLVNAELGFAGPGR